MPSSCYLFGPFVLDPGDRVLRRGGEAIELSARCHDALVLLVEADGRLVTKERFLAEAWHGVPVTDEALTQCIKTLRRTLDDDAQRPRFIETVTKHGYRSVAPVALEGPSTAPPGPENGGVTAAFWTDSGAGTVGAGVAGAVGGVLFGAVAAAWPTGGGGPSVLAVVLWLSIVTAVAGGAGVSGGIALAITAGGTRGWWRVVGGALGGLAIGAAVKLIGLDAFRLLLGRSPGAMAGGLEGVVLGAGVGLGSWWGVGAAPRTAGARAAAAGAVAIVALLGGNLMAGSLAALAGTFPEAERALAPFAPAGWAMRAAVAAAEGALFAGGVVGAMAIAGRRRSDRA